MVKDAYPYLIPVFLAAFLSWIWGSSTLAIVLLFFTFFVAFFFRDPDRRIPEDPSFIVSPADGKVVELVEQEDRSTRISIFLSIFDVHINRAPAEGIVESAQYTPGKFKVAYDPRASLENERNVLVIDHGSYKIKLSQIAGILARRIVCWKKIGDHVGKGERIGLIKFGSRVDLVLPENIIPTVKVGDRVKGGATVIGKVSSVR